MGIEVALLTATAASAYSGIQGRKEAANAAAMAADSQKKAQAEMRAKNAADAALERRQQIREQRVKQARIEQAAMDTGTTGSSGEVGSVGSISTQFESNLGFNLGAVQRGNNISVFNQEAADYNLQSQNALIKAQNNKAIFDLGASIFASPTFNKK